MKKTILVFSILALSILLGACAPKIVDCRDDIECFFNNLKQCNLAILGGEKTSFYKIESGTPNSCNLYIKIGGKEPMDMDCVVDTNILPGIEEEFMDGGRGSATMMALTTKIQTDEIICHGELKEKRFTVDEETKQRMKEFFG